MSSEVVWGDWRGAEAPKPAPTFKEMFDQAGTQFATIDRLGVTADGFEKAFEERNAAIKWMFGVELANPMAIGNVDATASDAFGINAPDREARQEKRVAEYMAKLKELAAQYPDHVATIRPDLDPREPVRKKAQEVERKTSELAQASGMVGTEDLGLVGKVPVIGDAAALGVNLVRAPKATIAQATGNFWASVPGPSNNFETLPDFLLNIAGFGRTGASKSLLKNAGLNALDSGLAEAVAQPLRQEQRKELGLEYGWQKAFEGIAGAAGGGFGLDLAVRVPGRTALQRFGRDAPAGEWFSREGRGGVFQDFEAPRGRVDAELARKAADGDVDAVEEVAKRTGVIDDPGVRGAINYARGGGVFDDERLAKLKAEGVDVGEDMALMAHALQGRYARQAEPIPAATTPLEPEASAVLYRQHGDALDEAVAALPAPLRRVVDVGLATGVPEIVAATREGIGGAGGIGSALNALAERMGADKLADLVTLHDGRASVADVALAMRRSPELVDSNVSLATDGMRQARAMAYLDEGAFIAAARGDVPAAVAAHIADAVPPGLHGAAIVAARGAPTVKDAIEAIDSMPLARPIDRGGKLADPAGPEAQAATARLEESLQDRVVAAEADLRERDELASQVETLRGELRNRPIEDAVRFRNPVSGEPMTKGDVDALVDMWRYAREQRKVASPQTLTQFLIAAGRVRDEAGELTAILGGRNRHMISGRGMTLDDAALKAWEAGFFADKERPTIADFLEAIREDSFNNSVIRPAEETIRQDKAIGREMERELEGYGIKIQDNEAAVRGKFKRARDEGAADRAGASPDGQSEVLAAKRQELAAAQARLNAVEARIARVLDDVNASPLQRDLSIVDRLGQMKDIIEACRA